ncbi:MAG: DinB family protein [Candidatus Eisenbacteria bacterium]|uniref:DinB family protein n=1 Tax=Eiseniibacteriota bacterium TaxID=2212470 RepID=A0A933WBN9_UNCEI|nr:DinB family protein [Candidatus Eisenbacteria bacterium]
MMRLRHGITIRVVDQLSDEQLNAKPIPGMRSALEIVVHMYSGMKQMLDGVVSGSLGESVEKSVLEKVKTKAQLLAYLAETWTASNTVALGLTDAQIGGLVKTPWGEPFPGFAILGFIHDEYLHHRGQVYAFVRTFGIEPVMLWDFDHNAPEFQKQDVKA